MRGVEFASNFGERFVARHGIVVAKSARIVVINMRERWNLRLRFEQLVDLLLVFGDGINDRGIV